MEYQGWWTTFVSLHAFNEHVNLYTYRMCIRAYMPCISRKTCVDYCTFLQKYLDMIYTEPWDNSLIFLEIVYRNSMPSKTISSYIFRLGKLIIWFLDVIWFDFDTGLLYSQVVFLSIFIWKYICYSVNVPLANSHWPIIAVWISKAWC